MSVRPATVPVGRDLTQNEGLALAFGQQIKESTEKGNYLTDNFYNCREVDAQYRPRESGFMDWFVLGYCCGGGCRPSGGNSDGKAFLVVAAIIALFASILTLIHAAISATQAGKASQGQRDAEGGYDQLPPDAKLKYVYNDDVSRFTPQARIYQNAKIIYSETKAERTATAFAQLAMGSGLAILTVAFLVAYAANSTIPSFAMDMIYYGGGITAAGLIGYGVVWVRYTSTQRPKIVDAYSEMCKAIVELEYIRDPKTGYSVVITEKNKIVVYAVPRVGFIASSEASLEISVTHKEPPLPLLVQPEQPKAAASTEVPAGPPPAYTPPDPTAPSKT